MNVISTESKETKNVLKIKSQKFTKRKSMYSSFSIEISHLTKKSFASFEVKTKIYSKAEFL